ASAHHRRAEENVVFRWLSQTLAVSALSVRTIPQRASSSAVAMIGIAGVVIVFVAVLSIGEGFRAAVADAGAPVRAVVLRAGASEAIVGGAANRQFSCVDLGSEFTSGNLKLRIVGIFESNGSVGETEIWCDSHLIQGVYERGNSYQSVLAKLDSPASFATFKNWLTTNPQLNVQVRRESEFYAQQSQVMSSLIRGIGYTIAVLMGIGAVFGAILTMYTAVATRTREIATLRALGFNTGSVLISVIAESLALAAIGGFV